MNEPTNRALNRAERRRLHKANDISPLTPKEPVADSQQCTLSTAAHERLISLFASTRIAKKSGPPAAPGGCTKSEIATILMWAEDIAFAWYELQGILNNGGQIDVIDGEVVVGNPPPRLSILN